MRPNPAISGERNRVQPKLTFTIGISHMNMNWFIAFVGEKMEAITPNAQNGRHLSPVCGRQPAWQSNSASFNAAPRIHVSIAQFNPGAAGSAWIVNQQEITEETEMKYAQNLPPQLSHQQVSLPHT